MKTNKLTATQAKSLGPGLYGDGLGVWLEKQDKDTGNFFLRISVHGKRKTIGLGSIHDVSLKDAREAAVKWRAVVRAGGDPLIAKAKERTEAVKKMHLFSDVVADTFESLKHSLKGDGKSGRWMSPLSTHVLPTLGAVPICDIDAEMIRDCLRPIWHEKHDVARKALNSIGLSFKHAIAARLPVDTQAPENAKILLGKVVTTAKPIDAMEWKDVPAYYGTLDSCTVAQLAMKMLILTGVRSFPLRHMREEDISIDGATWTVPAEQLKGQKGKTEAFAVPLSAEAQRVVAAARLQSRGDGYIFPSPFEGVISDMTLGMAMRRAGLTARPHGFRSSLRTFLTDVVMAPPELAEACLQHFVGNKVAKVYNRSDMLEQRRDLMERWSKHVTGVAPGKLRLVA